MKSPQPVELKGVTYVREDHHIEETEALIRALKGLLDSSRPPVNADDACGCETCPYHLAEQHARSLLRRLGQK